MDHQRAINSIRAFSADMVQRANSGHPGAPMGMAPMAYVLWTRVMNYSPSNPKWINRDRFVLSNGHACALLYTMLHWSGYEDFPIEQIKNFRQLGSNTPGHPESHFTGVEVTTGPLGQGISNAVGLALASAHLGATYNKDGFELFNNYTFVFCGDGCLQEGVSSEAASLAGHLGLGSLIVLYDDNLITIDGATDLSFSEDVGKRFESYGWQVLTVSDGDNDIQGIEDAIKAAKDDTARPTLIKVKTTIGRGSAKQGTEKVHGSPLGAEDLANVKKAFGLNPEEHFYLPDDFKALAQEVREKGKQKEQEWNELLTKYEQQYPNEAKEINRRFSGKLPENVVDSLPRYTPEDNGLATRAFSQKCLHALAPLLPELIGGSADLAPSNLTLLPNTVDFQKGQYQGRNLRFGVREHGMAAITNGISAYGGFLPYAATFLNFLGYCQGAVTLSALSGHHVFYVMTHDSIGLGEDGPTHQPVEKFLHARCTPGLLLLRPADGNEVSGAYACVLNDPRPAVLALSRQTAPNLAGSSVEAVSKGAYVLQEKVDARVILVGTGTEVKICVDAAKLAEEKGLVCTVVSMPSWELFDEQPVEYRQSVFPAGVPVLSVEAGTSMGWSRYAHASVGIDKFGASGKAEAIYNAYGLSPENVAEKAAILADFYKDNSAPNLVVRPF